MKYSTSLLILASLAVAAPIEPRQNNNSGGLLSGGSGILSGIGNHLGGGLGLGGNSNSNSGSGSASATASGVASGVNGYFNGGSGPLQQVANNGGLLGGVSGQAKNENYPWNPEMGAAARYYQNRKGGDVAAGTNPDQKQGISSALEDPTGIVTTPIGNALDGVMSALNGNFGFQALQNNGNSGLNGFFSGIQNAFQGAGGGQNGVNTIWSDLGLPTTTTQQGGSGSASASGSASGNSGSGSGSISLPFIGDIFSGRGTVNQDGSSGSGSLLGNIFNLGSSSGNGQAQASASATNSNNNQNGNVSVQFSGFPQEINTDNVTKVVSGLGLDQQQTTYIVQLFQTLATQSVTGAKGVPSGAQVKGAVPVWVPGNLTDDQVNQIQNGLRQPLKTVVQDDNTVNAILQTIKEVLQRDNNAGN